MSTARAVLGVDGSWGSWNALAAMSADGGCGIVSSPYLSLSVDGGAAAASAAAASTRPPTAPASSAVGSAPPQLSQKRHELSTATEQCGQSGASPPAEAPTDETAISPAPLSSCGAASSWGLSERHVQRHVESLKTARQRMLAIVRRDSVVATRHM